MLNSQVQRLNGIIKSKSSEEDNRFKESNEESQKLKKRILELER